MANKATKNNNWPIALRIFVNLSGWIFVPVIAGAFLGKWLDRKYNTEPWLFLGTLGFCFLISTYGLIVNATREFKKIEREARGQKFNIKTPADWAKEDEEKEAKFKNNNYQDDNFKD